MTSKKSNFMKDLIIAILAIVSLVLIFLIIFNKTNKSDVEKLLELNDLSYKDLTFSYINNDERFGNSTGVVELEGYVEVVNRGLPRVPDDSYIFFHIINSSSKEFKHFLNRIVELDKDGILVRDGAIGIGCPKDNVISMVIFADKYYDPEKWTEINLSIEDSQAILSSTKEKPVKIIIKIELDTSEDDEIPHCSTIITGIELVK